jgi:hypothetical protein
MKYKQISIILWLGSVIFTLAFVIYQRTTGPTYPLNTSITLNDKEYRFKLIRTFGGETDAEIRLLLPDTSVSGSIMLKRYKSYDQWSSTELIREGDYLKAYIPEQAPAGKVMYQIFLTDALSSHELSKEPVIIRFKGHVPGWIVLIHVVFIFAAMLLSTRTGLEAFINGRRVFLYTLLTLITLIIGGLVFGPIMQKYAFGAYWTGWPLGHDLTDNKTLIAFIFWIIALISLLRDRQRYIWVKVAAIVLILVYLIPHSVLGSEIDYTKTENKPVIEMTADTLISDTLPQPIDSLHD